MWITNYHYVIDADDEGIVIKYRDGSQLKYTADYVQLTNKYGDVEIIDSNNYQYLPTERPTYDELYEHWLKTK
jgi:hypothetical protein